MKANSDFPVLSSIASLIVVAGWLTVAAGVLRLLFADGGSVAELIDVAGDKAGWGSNDWAGLLASFGIMVLGLLQVALGEAVGVFFAIERNTAETTRQLQFMSMQLDRQRAPSEAGAARDDRSIFSMARKQRTGPPVNARTCPNCGAGWEFGEECPDCGVPLA